LSSAFEIQSARKSEIKLSKFDKPDPWVVCWYDQFRQNSREGTIPLVDVLLAKLHPDGSFNHGHSLKSFGVTGLGQLRIGSIWKNGVSSEEIKFREREFKVNLNERGWKFTNFRDPATAALVPAGAFRPITHDDAWLIQFELGGGRKLLIPCAEFFARCYGRSQHVNRVLTTYPESDWRDRLYVEDGVKPAPGDDWPIRLGRYVYAEDAVFLAHLKYDSMARRKAIDIYKQLDRGFRSTSTRTVVPKIGPWFSGEASILVQGIPYGSNVFYGLRVRGMSLPDGPTVVHAFVENENQPLEEDQSDLSGFVRRSQTPKQMGAPVPLTDDKAPQGGSEVADIHDAPFRIIGNNRKCVSAKSTSRSRGRAPSADPFPATEFSSTSSGHGPTKGVGYGSIHSLIEIPSSGAVLDVWYGMLKLQEANRHLLKDPGWLDKDANRHAATQDVPLNVGLPLFDADAPATSNPSESAKRISTWMFVNPKMADQRPRGVLVSCLTVEDMNVYFFELERRQTGRDDERADDAEGDEAGEDDDEQDGQEQTDGGTADRERFRGLVFQRELGAPLNVNELRDVLIAIRNRKGKMKKVVVDLVQMGEFHAYRRSRRTRRNLFIVDQLTVVNALSKVRIEVPKPKPKQLKAQD
jgi:hypothetical protein